MGDLPGELHERPWRDFGHNRTEALELGRPHGEYVLWIDADDGVAREKEALAHPPDVVIAAYIDATAACPTRAGALHGASRFCRLKGVHEQGYAFARQGLTLNYPKDAPLVEDWIYAYGLLDEFAVHAYWTERYHECLDACQRLIRERRMPTQEYYDRVKKNAEFAAEKLGLQNPIM